MFKFESTSTDFQTEQEFPAVIFTLRDGASLLSMIEAFESFLRASGYHFDGHLDLVEDEVDPDPIVEDLNGFKEN